MSEAGVCELCESNKVSLQCQTCKIAKLLCTNCYKATHYGDNKSSHEVKLLQSPDTFINSYTKALSLLTMEFFCSVHSKKSLEYVCKACDCVICCDCLLVGEHKGHDAVSFDKACEQITLKHKECLVREIEQKDKLKELQEIVGQKVKNREEKYKLWTDTVTEEFKKLIQGVQEKEKEILSQLEEEKQREFDGYEKLFKEIKNSQQENESKITALQQSIDNKISPLAYKEYKEKLPEVEKEYDVDLIGPFGNNKKMMMTIKEVLEALKDIFKLVNASNSMKLPPKSAKESIMPKVQNKPMKSEEQEAKKESPTNNSTRPQEKMDDNWTCEKCRTANPLSSGAICKKCCVPNKNLQKKQLFSHLKKIAEKEKKKFNFPSPCPLPSFLSFVCQHCGVQNNDRLTLKCLSCQQMQKKNP